MEVSNNTITSKTCWTVYYKFKHILTYSVPEQFDYQIFIKEKVYMFTKKCLQICYRGLMYYSQN